MNRFTLWFAFVLVHLWLGYQNLYSPSYPMGDVSVVYKTWVENGLTGSFWVGIDGSWVYPIVAMLPMLAAHAFGSALYASTWLSLIMVLDAIALASITGWGRAPRNLGTGWWWVAFVALLGPIAIGRIDSVSVAIAIVGALLLAAHPTAASVLVTLATWVKVWPAALIAAMLIAAKDRRAVLASVIGTSLGIIAIALAFGSGGNVFSFITEQTGRGLQVESPVATIWLWRSFLNVPSTFVYYDTDILTFQITGRGTELASALMTPLMGVAVAGVARERIRAQRRRMPIARLLPLLSLAFVTCLIVFNKVGSPQYVGWLAVPVILAFAGGGLARTSFHLPAAVALVVAALTQVIYPYLYWGLLTLNPGMLLVISTRNLLLVALFAWAVVRLARARETDPPIEGQPLRADWPESATELAPTPVAIAPPTKELRS